MWVSEWSSVCFDDFVIKMLEIVIKMCEIVGLSSKKVENVHILPLFRVKPPYSPPYMQIWGKNGLKMNKKWLFWPILGCFWPIFRNIWSKFANIWPKLWNILTKPPLIVILCVFWCDFGMKCVEIGLKLHYFVCFCVFLCDLCEFLCDLRPIWPYFPHICNLVVKMNKNDPFLAINHRNVCYFAIFCCILCDFVSFYVQNGGVLPIFAERWPKVCKNYQNIDDVVVVGVVYMQFGVEMMIICATFAYFSIYFMATTTT